MRKGFSACLAACAVIGALLIAPLALPGPALAESAVLSEETPLLEEPSPDAPVIALLALGTDVTLEGAPVDGYYPVASDALSGWLRGEPLVVVKEVVAGDTSADLVAEDSEAPVIDGQSEAIDPAVADAPGAAPIGPAPAPGDEAAPTTATTDPVPELPNSGLLPANAGVEVLDGGPAALPPAPAPPDDTPIAAPDAGPLGPASVRDEAPIFAGPGAEYGLISTAITGSTVEQTGHLVNGFVTVRYADVTGWAPIDHLAPSGATEYPAPPASDVMAVATPVAGILEETGEG